MTNVVHSGARAEGQFASPMKSRIGKFAEGTKMRGFPTEALVLMGGAYFAAITASISELGTTPPCPPAIRAGAMPRCLSAS